MLVAGSLSKTYAMTGWRIGFALAPAAVAHAILKLQSHSTSNPTSIAQKAAVEALQRAAGFGGRHARRVPPPARLRGAPAAPDSRRRVPGAARRLLRLPATSARRTPERRRSSPTACCTRRNVAVVPGEAFGAARHIRISYATSMHELERGLERIHRFIAE